MNAVLNFTFDGQVIRAMGDEDGKAWFVGKDICKILGFKNPNEAMSVHCLDQAKFYPVATSGGTQEARILDPIDVLQLIRRSTLPVSERFESWLLQEVWPALYKAAAGELSTANQAQLKQVQSILEISNAVIKSGVSARKSVAVALDQINGHKNGVAEPFRDRIMARIAARESANEASNDQAPIGLSTDQPHNQARNLMTSMTTFTFDDQTVRAMGDADGKAWFVGKDICKILKFTNPRKAMTDHCLEEAKFHSLIDSMGRSQEARILSPIDILQLVRRSTLPVPERFESWLLQEVWPALYKPVAGESGTAHQAQLDQVISILEISNAVIKSGVSARKSLSVALDVIHAQTGMAVAPFKELLRVRNSQSEVEANTSESVSPTRALKTGDLTEESVQAWRAFMALPAHERCLKLTWMAGTNARAAVLWQFCEHHHKKAAIGFEASAVKVSANDIAERSGQFFGCSVSGVRSTMSDMIQEGLLHVLPHVDNVTRKIWLDWPALQAALESTKFPELIFLELNWVAKNRAEMVVLHALTVDTNQAVCKLSPSALESQYRAMVDIDASALARAVKSLLAAEMIEQVGASDSRCIRLVPGKVEKLMEQFYLTDLQRLLA